MVNEEQNITKEKLKNDITTRCDIVFKNIFGSYENKKILEALLSAMFRKPVSVISVRKSVELTVNNINDKVGILDVQAILKDGTVVNIEMQNKKQADYNKRIMFYLGKLIVGQIKKSENYSRIKDVILVNILGYKLEDNNKIFSMYELNNKGNISNKIKGVKVYFLQIPRFEEKVKKLLEKNLKFEDIVRTKLDEWCVYFSDKNKELLDMVKVKNMEIEEALKLYEELQERDDVVDLYMSRWIAEMDRSVWEEEKKRDKAKMEKMKAKMKAKMEREQLKFEAEMSKIKAEISKVEEEKSKVKAEISKVEEEKSKVKAEISKVEEEKSKVKEEKSRIEVAKSEVEKERKKLEAKLEAKTEENLSQIIHGLLNQNVSREIILKATGISENKLKNILVS